MDTNQKLNYLRDYMNMWIDLRIQKEFEVINFWKLFDEFGIATATMFYNFPTPTFEYYLNWIQKNEL